MALKLKLDAENHVVVKDGKPVYIDDANNNEELAFDAEQMRSKISELNGESKTHRLSAKELRETLDKFGDAKPEEIASFRTTLAELGGPDGIAKLKEAGKVDVEAVKKSMDEAWGGKLSAATKDVESRDATIRQLLIGNGIATSEFLKGTTFANTRDVAEAYFGKHFRVENGKPVAYIGDNMLFSKEKPGEPASVNEALSLLINQHPQRDSFLLSTGGGSGARQGSGGAAGAKTITLAAMNEMRPVERAAFFAGGGELLTE